MIDINQAREQAAEAVREARATDSARVAAINQACQLGGCPERAGEFIAGEMTAEQVGAEILEARAENAGEAIDGRHAGTGSAAADPVIDTQAIYDRRARQARGEE